MLQWLARESFLVMSDNAFKVLVILGMNDKIAKVDMKTNYLLAINSGNTNIKFYNVSHNYWYNILVSYWRGMDLTMAFKIDSKGSCRHIKSDKIPSDIVTKMRRHMTSTLFDFRLCSPMTFASSSSTTTIIL